MKTALAITHVSFEDLGSLFGVLRKAGFQIEYVDATGPALGAVDPLSADLMVVLGGPIGVYEQAAYPFLGAEIALLHQRLTRRLPTVGICLGAQLMAAALGANVFPGTQGKEIGWFPVFLPESGALDNPLYPFLKPDINVLHWHGDTFDIPPGARRLASSVRYENQAFALGNYALALQFHPEAEAVSLERWYVGHACELSLAHIDVGAMRAQSAVEAPRLQLQATPMWEQWLSRAFAVG